MVACMASSMLFANHWTSENPGNYSLVMGLNGIIQINGEEQSSDQLEVGAFCNGECRGSQMASVFPITGRYIIMLSIDGENGDQITFKLYDHSLGQELDLASPDAVTFNNDGLGGYFEPYVLNFTGELPSSAFHFTTPGHWSTASNWQGGALPEADDEVFIDAPCQLDQNATVSALTVSDGQSLILQTGYTLTVTGALANTVATGLVIKDGAQLVNATGGVSATMQKDIIAYGTGNPDGWYTIASPMDEMPIEGSDFLMERYDLYRFDERNTNQNEWENYKAGHEDFTTFENGRGYLYANTNSFSPAFTGTLNAAEVTRNLTYTERTDALSGFNLIGNPFPHVIYKGIGGAIDNANLASGYYTLTNEGAWHVHTYEDAILPGQGILVKTTAATDLTIAKSNATATSETSGAKAATGRLDISVAGNGGEDRAFAYFSQGIGLDKMGNFSETVPSLWIRDNGNDYAIAHIDNSYESLDLFFHNTQNGDFTLTFTATDTNFSQLQLTDRITGTVIDLLRQPQYTFHATGNEYEARFEITFKVAMGVEENQQQSFCFVKDKVLYVNTETQHAQVTLTDVMGRTVKSTQLTGNACSVADLTPGIYFVRLTDRNDVLVQKILINN